MITLHRYRNYFLHVTEWILVCYYCFLQLNNLVLIKKKLNNLESNCFCTILHHSVTKYFLLILWITQLMNNVLFFRILPSHTWCIGLHCIEVLLVNIPWMQKLTKSRNYSTYRVSKQFADQSACGWNTKHVRERALLIEAICLMLACLFITFLGHWLL